MTGHVFIIRADIRRLACDAWLIPTSKWARPGDNWFPDSYRGPRGGAPFVDGGPRAQHLPSTPADQPQPWLARVAGRNRPPKWYADGAVEFLHAAASAIVKAGATPLFGRARHLLALPLVGTGLGGAADVAGEILQTLLPELEQFADTRIGGKYFDVALVTYHSPAFAAAQAYRQPGHWDDQLDENLRGEAATLAKRAAAGELALFLGAGVSMAAGVPDWRGMLRRLAIEHAGMTEAECDAMDELPSVLDQATLIERRLARKNVAMGQAVKAVVGAGRHYALTHALLASLPVREVVTTNYDELFDQAWAEVARDNVSILPTRVRPGTHRWLLKMHGCVSDPERIVLTRSSYNRYDAELPALAGAVQALLLTRHVLFIGFSLTDDNFHRIVDAVRRLLDSEKQIGTTLSLGSVGLMETIWDEDVHRVRMDERKEEPGFPYAEAARRLQVFLDYLLWLTRDTAHLLVGDRFDGLLSPGERRLRDALARFWNDLCDRDAAGRLCVNPEVRQTVAWRNVEAMLHRLGFNADLLAELNEADEDA